VGCCGGKGRILLWLGLAALVVAGVGVAVVLWPREPESDEPRRRWPGENWDRETPAAMGMDSAKLDALRDLVGGDGSIVCRGRMVYGWGKSTQRYDLASAAKPVLVHLLLKSIEQGKIGGLDETVARFEPRLSGLNAPLGHKDRDIRWRHLACQTACYGVTEGPGKAFNYSDYQIALFMDLLIRKVHGCTWETATTKVLGPLLTGPLRCRHKPAFVLTDDGTPRLFMSTEDFARFGWLYCCGGKWQGDRLMRAEDVSLVTGSPLPNTIPRTLGNPAEMLPDPWSFGAGANQTDHLGSYSYTWWINGVDRQGNRHWASAPLDAYAAIGVGGRQALVVLPGLDVVAAWHHGNVRDRGQFNQALGLLVQAAGATVAP